VERSGRFAFEAKLIEGARLLYCIIWIEKRPGLNLWVYLAHPRQTCFD